MSETRVDITVETSDDPKTVYVFPSFARRPELDELLAAARTHVITDEEHQAQRESWARSCRPEARGERQAVRLNAGPCVNVSPARPNWLLRLLVRLAKWIIRRYVP